HSCSRTPLDGLRSKTLTSRCSKEGVFQIGQVRQSRSNDRGATAPRLCYCRISHSSEARRIRRRKGSIKCRHFSNLSPTAVTISLANLAAHLQSGRSGSNKLKNILDDSIAWRITFESFYRVDEQVDGDRRRVRANPIDQETMRNRYRTASPENASQA